MTTKTAEYRSCVRLNCGVDLPTSVILCVPPEIVVQRNPPYESSTIDAVMETETCTSGYGCAAAYWTYQFSYDDAQLIEGAILTGSDITGVICVNCFTQWTEEIVFENLAATVIPTGLINQWFGSTPPLTWLMLQGGTIGSAFSGATVRANADTQALYEYLWNTLANAEAPVSSGRGASAALDFAANKTITLPDMRQRFPLGVAAAGTGATVGGTGGLIDHTHPLSAAGYAKIGPDDSIPDQVDFKEVILNYGGDRAIKVTSIGGVVAPNTATSAVELGGNTDAANPPFLALNFIIKL